MKHGTAHEQEVPPGAKMTMRVYAVSREGAPAGPAATVKVPYDYRPAVQPFDVGYPPCACPRHRRLSAAR